MRNTKNRLKIITILAFLVAVLSIGVGYSSYNTTIEVSGKAIAVETMGDLKIDNINNPTTTIDTILYKEQPVIEDNKIVFSITSFSPGNSVSFNFDLTNNGIIPIKISDIRIEGIDEYKDNFEYSITNINIGDIINRETNLLNNVFTMTYKEAVRDEYNNPLNLNLDNVTLVIEYEQNRE